MATILIVDDLAANRKVLVALLRDTHRMLEAADGYEALTTIEAERPDLVITDVLMPVMDGYELVRRLRLDSATNGIPVVFYTAHYGQREARALAESCGVSHILTKPVDPDEVVTIVDSALAGQLHRKASTAALITPEFDTAHLRLLTDKLSETAGDVRVANARLRALINIGLELASERDLERLLQTVCVAARDLFGATYVTLGIVDRHDRTVQRFVINGTESRSATRSRGCWRPLSTTAGHYVAKTPEAIRPDWSCHPAIRRFAHFSPLPWRRRRRSTGGSVWSATRDGSSVRPTRT
jgi:CheY-like chemotaxis protein